MAAKKFLTEENVEFWIDIQDEKKTNGKVKAGGGDTSGHSSTLYKKALANVVPFFKSTQSLIDEVKPDSFEIEVGVKFDSNINVFLVTLGGETEFKIKMIWNKK